VAFLEAHFRTSIRLSVVQFRPQKKERRCLKLETVAAYCIYIYQWHRYGVNKWESSRNTARQT
jgi:hypothetical protein